jgi:alanyl-tRNA synthetase
MTASEIINKYIAFFEKRGHKRIPNSPLVPLNDPTTLFTSSGMQPLVPYLLGEEHSDGKRLVNVQNCFRAQDIEEIGNNRHTTFFRMLGNWSLGDYFKHDQLPWFFEFLTSELKLDPNKLYVTVFKGDKNSKVVTSNGSSIELGLDADSIAIWKKCFDAKKINPQVVDMTNPNITELEISTGRIFEYGAEKNWWSRAGAPDKMPAGEPGGPDSEVFYDFGIELKNHENSPYKDQLCHPNCDCGRFMEIGNSVFMQFQKQKDGTFKELPNKNVDFGGGLERLAAAVNDDPDIFKTDLYSEIIEVIEEETSKSYDDPRYQTQMRVIADHLKAATYLIVYGVRPSNKEQGYVLRRLLRRAVIKMHQIGGGLNPLSFATISQRGVLNTEQDLDKKMDRSANNDLVDKVITEEIWKFNKSLDKGLKELEKRQSVDGKFAFYLFQTYGFPFEITQELLSQKGKSLDYNSFKNEYEKHKQLSKSASSGMFRGGLADHQERTIMGHTATHLMHQALRDMFGKQLHQTGSNITNERVRFDFNFERKLTDEEVEALEKTVNEKIEQDLPVHFEMIPTEEAKKMGAIGLFDDTYQETSKIYFIGGGSENQNEIYSIEFCGGPHVDFTGKLKSFKIIKQENIGNKQRRIYAVVG